MTDTLFVNPGWTGRERAVPPADAIAFHRSLPGYRPTPLVDAPAAARALGVARVLVKDESSRFGLPSFKVLGASWATHCAVGDRRDVALVCATDGNHGRAVAWMARRLGLPATVFVPANMVAARRAAIAGEGARVEVIDGTYDEAVEHAAGLASEDVLVIQDTAWAGYQTVPGWVIDGYGTIGAEIEIEPDVLAVQIGVGSFAAAMVRRFASPTRIIGVEPATAACALASMKAGVPVRVPGPHDSVMAGLNCGLVSWVTWPALAAGIEAFAAIEDSWAYAAVELLAADGVVAGESGAAGLAGLLAFRESLALSRDSAVLVVNTEGATG
ncbi:MAG TPA: pyridoxal-phosphate dependent enzyme [Solirubrobacteraceae bacterium]|nr:pyridoxal-phosphate dependent enzyme [Solirubrobacteraceae bacterium]